MTPPPDSMEAVRTTAERCADAMAARWRAGERPTAEDYLDADPDLWDRADAALELIAEELALRGEYGPPVSAAELVRRFPQWPGQVAALLDCHLALGPRPGAPKFPAVGDWLGDFLLRAELGRGAHARVYLATQPALADRPVVLKVGPDHGAEHLSLARLQHTHIVPLYSVHEFPDRGLRALCMPYFGGKTLAEIQSRLGPLTPGADWLAAIGDEDPSSPIPVPPKGPVWRFLQRASFPDAVCWIGACLADALQYAHDRGLVHLDLKPSNVLLAADGLPMLLDFHLARPPLAADESAPGWLGGTPGFMAPEQEAAVAAVRAGLPVPVPVDGRADVYALGLLLRGLFRDAGCNPSAGLADVLARCVAVSPDDRYRTASAVATDLRRHLADLPLKGVRNRSVYERWRKWRRRRPYAAPLLLAFAALAAVGGGLAFRADRLADRAEVARRVGLSHLGHRQFTDAQEAFRRGEDLLTGLPFHADLREQLRVGRLDAARGEAGAQLHAVADRARILLAARTGTKVQTEEIATKCREYWNQRDAISAELRGTNEPWRSDLLDIGLLAAEMTARTANPEAALGILDEADAGFGPSVAIELERARHATAAGKLEVAAAAERKAASLPANRPWELVLVGRSYLAANDLPKALSALDRAVAQEPQSLWANHYRGTCLLQLKKPVEAASAYSACIALAPTAAWCFYNRGLAFLAAHRFDAAEADFNRAIALDPDLTSAYQGQADTVRRRADAPKK